MPRFASLPVVLRRPLGPAALLWPCVWALVASFAGAGCGAQCREIDIVALPIACDQASLFSGEIHLDSAATFDTFLAQQCMTDATDEEVSALVEQVDFSTQGVFVASGQRNVSDGRCIAAREAERAQVCDGGLKVYFQDTYASDDPNCLGRWTTGFALSRGDLRAVLAVDD